MNLSKRAIDYLQTLNRDSEWITSELATTEYLKKLNFAFSKKVLDVQLNYSGYQLSIKNQKGNPEQIAFISAQHIEKNKKIYTERIENTIILSFQNAGSHMLYFITENGEICTKDEDSPRKIHYTFEKIETKIEQFALLNEWHHFNDFHSSTYEVYDYEKLITKLSGFEKVAECSDHYNFCCRNDQAIIFISPWVGSQGKHLIVYGIDQASYRTIIKELQNKNLIE